MAFYSDIDFEFRKNNNNDISVLTDNQAIKVSIMNLMMFSLHDLFLNDIFKGFLKTSLFENNDQITVNSIDTLIRWSLNEHEPRIKLIDVDVDNSVTTQIQITIKYIILKDGTEDKVTYLRDIANDKLRTI